MGGGIALLLLILVFFLGRKGGLRKSTVIEIKRS